MIYPKGEIVWTGYYNSNHELLFLVTSKPSRDYYYLYEYDDGTLRKLGRGKTPRELEDKFGVSDRMIE